MCFALHTLYGQVLRKDENDWVKKCTDYKVEGVRPGGMPNKTWSKVIQKDCQFQRIRKEDAMDCRTRRLASADRTARAANFRRDLEAT